MKSPSSSPVASTNLPPTPRSPRTAALVVWIALSMFGVPFAALASFHLWKINEIYSNEDGTVQFIELTCTNNGQEFMSNHVIRCIGPQATNTFTYLSNLATGTLNKSMLMATTAFTNVPGAVTPDYFIPANFIPRNGGQINFGLNQHILNYTNLITDGIISFLRVTNGGVTNLSLAQTNSPRNYAGAQGSLVPLRVLSVSATNSALVVAYPTATGKAYVTEVRDSLAVTNWVPLATNAGDGTVLNSTNSFSNLTQRVFRVRAQ